MGDQEQVLKAKVRVACACGRTGDVQLQLKIALTFPGRRAQPNPYSGHVSSLVDTNTQIDGVPQHAEVPGNIMTLVDDDELESLTVECPDITVPTTVPTSVASSSVPSPAASSSSAAKKARRE